MSMMNLTSSTFQNSSLRPQESFPLIPWYRRRPGWKPLRSGCTMPWYRTSRCRGWTASNFSRQSGRSLAASPSSSLPAGVAKRWSSRPSTTARTFISRKEATPGRSSPSSHTRSGRLSPGAPRNVPVSNRRSGSPISSTSFPTPRLPSTGQGPSSRGTVPSRR